MEKINIAELLRDCPSGMELDCAVYEDVYFDYVDGLNIIHCYIQYERHKISITFNQYGTPNSDIKSKCVIFPKGKTTWGGFVPPYQFKDGDIIYNQGIKATAIFYKQTDDNTISHCFLNVLKELKISHYHSKLLYDWRLATEEEKAKLFQAIKDNGYRWNEETKTLEKLIEPIFKVGDRIRHKTHIRQENAVTEIKDTHYILDDELALPFISQNEYELVPNKFDISNLKPFDKVLVRDFDNETWEINFFSRLLDGKHFKCFELSYVQCIPYEGNEHLLGTTNDCDDYFDIPPS